MAPVQGGQRQQVHESDEDRETDDEVDEVEGFAPAGDLGGAPDAAWRILDPTRTLARERVEQRAVEDLAEDVPDSKERRLGEFPRGPRPFPEGSDKALLPVLRAWADSQKSARCLPVPQRSYVLPGGRVRNDVATFVEDGGAQLRCEGFDLAILFDLQPNLFAGVTLDVLR